MGNYRIEPRSDDDFDLIYVGVAETNYQRIPFKILAFPTVSKSEPYLLISSTSRSPINVRLFDATGRRILKVRFKPDGSAYGNVYRVNLNKTRSLSSGAYFIIVEQDDYKVVRSFVKIH